MRQDGRLPSLRELFHDRTDMDKNRDGSDRQHDSPAGIILLLRPHNPADPCCERRQNGIGRTERHPLVS